METLATAMESLRISEFFLEAREPRAHDRDRLTRGLDLIKRILAAILFLDEGQAEFLEEPAFNEARYASATARQLQQAASLPEARKYIEGLGETLESYISGTREGLERGEREKLAEFFGGVGEAMMSDVIDRVAFDPDDVSAQTSGSAHP